MISLSADVPGSRASSLRPASAGAVPRRAQRTRLGLTGAVACAVALLVAGCGGGGGGSTTFVPVAVPTSTPTPEPEVKDLIKPYREQTVSWEVCDPSILGATDEGQPIPLDTASYGDRLRCAYVRVPIDYADPARGDLWVAMMRITVADASKRRGALFFNPGGPGEDGLAHTTRLLEAFAGSDDTTVLGRLQLQLLAEYDMVSFSPRGTGASTRLQCGTNELQREVDPTPEGRTPQAVEDMLYNSRKTAEACHKNPLTPYINSDATAQDMDLMRGLLGEQKLNYLGYSYGTWLGAWYASRYPERVGRMVLDSSMNFTSNGDEAERMTPPAVQRVLDEVYAAYAARHPDAFNLGQTPAEVRAVVPAINAKLRAMMTAGVMGDMYNSALTGTALIRIRAAQGLGQLIQTMPGADADHLAAALPGFVFVPGNSTYDAAAREKAAELLTAYFEDDDKKSSIDLKAGDATYRAVMCNDTAGITDVSYWVELGNQYAVQYPLMGSQVTSLSCAYWGGPSVTKPPVSALASLDILMVQSQYDKATAAEGAWEAFKALPMGHMVYVPGESSHALYPYRDQCVDMAVTRYLLGESPAQRETVCVAHPLKLDAPVVALRSVASRSAYKDPETAAALIERFKDGITSGARSRGL